MSIKNMEVGIYLLSSNTKKYINDLVKFEEVFLNYEFLSLLLMQE